MKKQLIAILLTALACLGPAAGAYAAEDAAEVPAVYVESEFAPLKRVIVSQSEVTDSTLPVVEVLRPRMLTEEELALAALPEGPTHGRGLSNFFVRDPFIVVGDHVIEANFRKEYRRCEALTARDLFQGCASYVGLPMPDFTDAEAGPFLEGGDVIVYHRKIFVGNSGYGSNSAGIRWLRDYLAPYGYEVEEVRLQGKILHLDCVMSLVREGLMIVCEESFADGIPETFRDWDKILVPEEDAEQLAVNGMAINPEVYITDIAFRDTIGKELEARGIKVEYLDFHVTRMSAGSVHCSTQPLLRVDENP